MPRFLSISCRITRSHISFETRTRVAFRTSDSTAPAASQSHLREDVLARRRVQKVADDEQVNHQCLFAGRLFAGRL
jgi:hypothetical protein